MANNKPPPIMRWQEVAAFMRCGRSKAMLILHSIGAHYSGRTPYVTEGEFLRYLAEHDGNIVVKWSATTK